MCVVILRQLSQIQKPCKKTGWRSSSCTDFRRFLSEYSWNESAHKNWHLLGITFVSHKKNKIPKSCTKLTGTARVSWHARVKRHLPILWSLILCFLSQWCWCAAAHSSKDILLLCWASFGGFCGAMRRVACFYPQVQEASSSQSDTLQQINQITSCDSIHLPLTSHLLIYL